MKFLAILSFPNFSSLFDKPRLNDASFEKGFFFEFSVIARVQLCCCQKSAAGCSLDTIQEDHIIQKIDLFSSLVVLQSDLRHVMMILIEL